LSKANCKASQSFENLKQWILESQRSIQRKIPPDASYEMIFIFYSDSSDSLVTSNPKEHPLYIELRNFSLSHPQILLIHHSGFPGRGDCLRTGFLHCSGKKILIADLEQACDPEFFELALKHLDNYALVRANRRLPESQFKIPVRLLPLIYGRHRLGLIFNWILRALLPIQTTDTHSGTYGITWPLAAQTFAIQSSPGFLFDLELSLTSVGHGYKEKDLPVSILMEEEKRFQQIFLETLDILFDLPAVILNAYRGYYRNLPQIKNITADDWGLSPAVNQGILKLAKHGVVKRISLMANCPYLQLHLNELSGIADIELGLHWNLTYGKGALSPLRLCLQWLNPLANRKELRTHVRNELSHQLQILKKAGLTVQYLDGHHHIHLIPGLIDAVSDLLKLAGIEKIRLPYDRTLWLSPQFPILLLSLLAAPRMKRHGLNSLECSYPKKSFYLNHGALRAKLAKKPHAEVIVHPAEWNDLDTLEYPDSYTHGRVLEFQALRMLYFSSKPSPEDDFQEGAPQGAQGAQATV
jgi:predicted glycoside hydrolase/deacetylase ChbG (UPF0249 family)